MRRQEPHDGMIRSQVGVTCIGCGVTREGGGDRCCFEQARLGSLRAGIGPPWIALVVRFSLGQGSRYHASMRDRSSWLHPILCILASASFGTAQQQRPVFDDATPLGLPELTLAEGHRMDPATFALGERLFFDPGLSLNAAVSCSSCHQPEFGFSHPDAFAPGHAGTLTKRRPPPMFNRGYGTHQGWDGRASSLEEFVLLPLQDPDEMGSSLDASMKFLNADAGYVKEFDTIFGHGPDAQSLAASLAGYVRGLRLGNSPVDAFIEGDRNALDVEERAGMWIWESKGRCWKCHPRPFFSDESFHNTGIGAKDGVPELGRMGITQDAADHGRFKTPTLRGLVDRAPYMHNGSLATLADVVAFYRRGGNANEHLSPKLEPLNLSDREAANLVAFLRALSRQQD